MGDLQNKAQGWNRAQPQQESTQLAKRETTRQNSCGSAVAAHQSPKAKYWPLGRRRVFCIFFPSVLEDLGQWGPALKLKTSKGSGLVMILQQICRFSVIDYIKKKTSFILQPFFPKHSAHAEEFLP